eukprot:TRINITY_DN32218_c0_g1_i1.p1 TRINITY_DN32218_c0_g1~~TRINITY_DN32218_c0_g1_i1.p1  ORF type:complete len:350 (-),score=51.59 TRINITY_DN32218_c0_g1_i1:31-1080(-)
MSSLVMGLVFMMLVEGHVLTGLCFLALGVVTILWIFFVRNRVQFAEVLLDLTVSLMAKYTQTVTVIFFFLFIQSFYILFWVFAVYLAMRRHSWTLSICLFVSLYWTTQVIKYIVHVTISGTVAAWYFYTIEDDVPPNATLNALRRSLTTSFGSIAIGAFCVPIVRLFRSLSSWFIFRFSDYPSLQRTLQRLSFVLGRASDALIRNWNKYAFTQISVYGKAFRHAARDAWVLMDSKGIVSIINDDMVDHVLLFDSLVGAAFCAGFLGVWVHGMPHIRFFPYLVSLAFVIGFVTTNLTMEVVESMLTTLVCAFSENQEPLERIHPIVYHRLTRLAGRRDHFQTLHALSFHS